MVVYAFLAVFPPNRVLVHDLANQYCTQNRQVTLDNNVY